MFRIVVEDLGPGLEHVVQRMRSVGQPKNNKGQRMRSVGQPKHYKIICFGS